MSVVHGQAFNTGSPEATYLIRDLAEIVSDVVAGSDVSFAEGAGTDPRSYKVDFSKISSVLPAFRCEWDARRGAESLASAYRAASMDEALFTGDRFTRLLRLRALLAAGRLDGELRWQEQVLDSSAA